jgi:hypothetical protein
MLLQEQALSDAIGYFVHWKYLSNLGPIVQRLAVAVQANDDSEGRRIGDEFNRAAELLVAPSLALMKTRITATQRRRDANRP